MTRIDTKRKPLIFHYEFPRLNITFFLYEAGKLLQKSRFRIKRLEASFVYTRILLLLIHYFCTDLTIPFSPEFIPHRFSAFVTALPDRSFLLAPDVQAKILYETKKKKISYSAYIL